MVSDTGVDVETEEELKSPMKGVASSVTDEPETTTLWANFPAEMARDEVEESTSFLGQKVDGEFPIKKEWVVVAAIAALIYLVVDYKRNSYE